MDFSHDAGLGDRAVLQAVEVGADQVEEDHRGRAALGIEEVSVILLFLFLV